MAWANVIEMLCCGLWQAMGNRCTYPADQYRARSREDRSREGGSSLPPPQPPSQSLPHSGAPYPPLARSAEQTLCPRCQRILLVPPGAPLFRCPCGVLFRTNALAARPPPPNMLFGTRAVMCRRCRNVSVAPPDGAEVIMCSCGAPLLPINDMLMSLIAEGAHLQAQGRTLRDEENSASRDLIEMLPTCIYSKVEDDKANQQKAERHGHGDDVSCRVCLDDYLDGEELRVLPCFHKFHKNCIDSWLERKKLCPLCNTSVDIILQDSREFG